ncbi:UDP-N-acetylenolpyruvoylglucosamine reductase [Betaproteobacteria bacterium GR16-43]|nr:UDP-N-acetylenolpyruvoylglucosamine reductase [Betaproteobacteria bacterium GR16-43]
MLMSDLPRLRHDEPMSRHVSWRAGGVARTFYQPTGLEDLCAFLAKCSPDEPLLFVGLGSNLLVRDGGFRGTVILTHHALMGITIEPGLRFTALAGVPTPHLARHVAKHGGGGAEWMAGVPGTIGGALAMNAGCYGGETWNHVVSVRTVDRFGVLHERGPEEFEVAYRHVAPRSPREEWFVAATFAFTPGDEVASMATMKALLQRRVASQPLNQPNAGSVFRNPPGDHAARLIESCGLKGCTIGGAQVSPRHANFIVNVGGATAADLEELIDDVQAEVFGSTGVELVREVRIVGEPV